MERNCNGERALRVILRLVHERWVEATVSSLVPLPVL